MDVFLQIVLAFPTVLFSVVLTVAAGYWLMAALGIVEIDALDAAQVPDGDSLDIEGVAGLLMKFRLGGIPLSLILTVLVFFAWLASYFTDYLLLRHLPFEWLRWVLGVVVMLLSALAGLFATSFVLRPFRKVFERLRPASARSILGQVGVVRSPDVSPVRGYAAFDDGGAALTLQVRSHGQQAFQRGDRVVLIEYLATENAYRVIGEDEFQGL
ncbi:hypothetical protein [Montanilutibacter psychrotolerans]|uniref:DUF1449 family protein n=1 Tax=Montanilutibacter psychrotolerans TaxID=1327343 RepID=A0A3M8SMC5_9GAMM|nr:hypothetical protein [Lysobacter psychrotolerans]RNF82379.1 hypothetical protein EER27_14615 [Lysobacter psychrotolerans]